MNDEELNKAIHEWMGRGCYHDLYWKPHELGGSTLECKNGCPVSLFEKNPDYCQDHNAVREFLAVIKAKGDMGQIIDNLCKAINSNVNPVAHLIFATPRQLAEAGARAVGIWEDKSEQN